MRARDELRIPHPVSQFEKRLLEKLLPETQPLRRALLEQASHAQAQWLDSLGQPAIVFTVPEHLATVHEAGVVAEAEATDRDRGIIHLLLHVRDGRLAEVEVYREDGRAVVEFPDAAKLKSF